jgi:hypothetical protein
VTVRKKLIQVALLQRAEIEVDLTSSILPVANWRAASVPKFLPAEEVEQVVAAVDRRDYLKNR